MDPERARAVKPALEVKSGRAMRALAELLRNEDTDPFALFDASLELLVRQFTVDHALITRLREGQLDTFWWAHAGTGAGPPMELHQGLKLCERTLQEPEGSLAIGMVFPSEGGPWLQAFAGVVVREGGRPVGTLSVLHSSPFVFSQDDLNFIKSVAGFVGRALEIENLKYDLQVARETLALSSAVVQDSALESEATGLPSRRFLDIWMKGHMHHARRQKEMLALALWEGRADAAGRRALRALSQKLRGDDLLVELGPERFLLLMPQTTREGAQTLLERELAALGRPAVGATLWLADRDDLLMHAALQRAELARREAAREGSPDRIRWKLPTFVALNEPA